MSHYEKLRPSTYIEVCECVILNRILLVYIFSNNPIHCFECKNEIDPERLGLTEKQVDQIASWNRVSEALNNLWLNSGEYESWAKDKLLDKNGQVNIEGLAIASEMSKYWPTYYWWFYEDEDPLPIKCPNCGQRLDKDTQHGHGKCNICHVVV